MDQAARGAAALRAGNFQEAVEQYTAAIAINSSAPDYYIKRSSAYHRLHNFQEALKDAEIGVSLATKRAKKELVAEAQLRRAIPLFSLERYGDSQHVFGIVKKLKPNENSLGIWESKLKKKMAELDPEDEKVKVTVKDVPDVEIPSQPTAKVTEGTNGEDKKVAPQEVKAAAPVQTPPSQVKHDFYQSNENVVLTLKAKGVPKDKLTVEILKSSVCLPSPSFHHHFKMSEANRTSRSHSPTLL